MDRVLQAMTDESHHFIAGAFDHEQLTSFDYAILMMYGDRDVIDGIVNADRGPSRKWTHRNGLVCIELHQYAVEISEKLPPVIRNSAIAYGLRDAARFATTIVEVLTNWRYIDSLAGGCLVPHRRIRRHDRDFKPRPRMARHLVSPKAIRRYVAQSDEGVPHLRSLFAELIAASPPERQDATLCQTMLREHEAKVYGAIPTQDQLFAQMMRGALIARVEREKRRQTRERRKVIRKAASIATAVLGAATVSSFARGEPVMIRGQEMAFELKSSGDLGRLGHGGMKVNLHSLEGDFLAGLCVYVDNTPTLDQLVAFQMHVESGDERHILNTANLMTISDAGRDHDLIKERVKGREEMLQRLSNIDWQSDWQLQTQAADEHLNQVGRVYLDAVCVNVFGRHAQRVMAF